MDNVIIRINEYLSILPKNYADLTIVMLIVLIPHGVCAKGAALVYTVSLYNSHTHYSAVYTC